MAEAQDVTMEHKLAGSPPAWIWVSDLERSGHVVPPPVMASLFRLGQNVRGVREGDAGRASDLFAVVFVMRAR